MSKLPLKPKPRAHINDYDKTEVFALIKVGLPGYLITKDARLWSLENEMWMATWVIGPKQRRITALNMRGRRYSIRLARLMAEAWLGIPQGATYVCHSSKEPGWNGLEGLVWTNSNNLKRCTVFPSNLTPKQIRVSQEIICRARAMHLLKTDAALVKLTTGHDIKFLGLD